MKQQDIAVIGLAVMGRSLALNMADHGFAVAAYNRSYAVSEQMAKNHPHPHIHIYRLCCGTEKAKESNADGKGR